MTERQKSIFTRESLDHVSSPEKLDDYIRIASPGIWILIIALLITAAAVIFWGVTGSLPKSVTVNGVVDPQEGHWVVCLVDALSYEREDLQGKEALISFPDSGTVTGVVQETSELPFSENELLENIENEWTASKLIQSEYSYVVWIETEEDELSLYDNKILSISIITGEVRPISLLFG